ncbi:hypothetical protein KFL_002410150, partial [Klebsormidium nitens]
MTRRRTGRKKQKVEKRGADTMMGEERGCWDLSARSAEQKLGQAMLHDVAPPRSAACELLLQACEEGPGRSGVPTRNRLSRAGVRGLYEQMVVQKQRAASLKDRVVLVGRSGTGKTRLINDICEASEPDASEYCARVQEKIAQIGEWDELTLVDAEPHEIPRADTVAAARAGDRVEVYFPESDEWCEGEVVRVERAKHVVKFPGEAEPATLSLRDHDVPEASGAGVWARKIWNLRFESRRPEPEPEVQGSFYLLPEGDVSDTTQVKCEITAGPRARARIYYEPIAAVAEPILRLKDLWRTTKSNDSPPRGARARPSKRSLVDMLDLGASDGDENTAEDGVNTDECGAKTAVEGGVNAGEDAEIVRERWLQTALALLGKPVNTPVSDLVEADFELPARCRARLSAAPRAAQRGRQAIRIGNPVPQVEIFAPCRSTSPGGTDGDTLYTEHIFRIRHFVASRTWGCYLPGGRARNEPHWRLVHKVVIQLAVTAALLHDFVDLPGVSNDAGPFGADALEAAIRRLAKTLLICTGEEGDQETAIQQKPVAAICAGDLWWKEENARVHSTALVTGHAHNTQAERNILQDAERDWVSARRLAVAAALENLLIARENLPRGLAEEKAREIAARVTFLVIYPGLLYHPKCIRMFGQQIQYLPISEDDSRMPQLQDFLREGGRGDRSREVRALVARAQELLGRFEEMGAGIFALARAVVQPNKLRTFKDALARASATKKLKLPRMPGAVLAGAKERLRESLDESVEGCTDLRCGQEIARLVPHNSDQPGRVPPSRFEGDLQQALDSGPVPPLLNHMEFEDVHLQDVMIAPFQLHQTENLYRVLGIAAAGGAAADGLIRCNVDAIVARHVGGLRATRVFEVIRRAAEQETAAETARLCIRLQRGKQKRWGQTASGQKSKMAVIESAGRPLAAIGTEMIVEGIASRLRQALSHVTADLRSLLPRLNLRELHTLMKRAHLAALASLLARAQSLQTRLGEVLLIEEGLDDVGTEHDDVAEWRDWGAGETRDLLAALERAGFGGSDENRAKVLWGVLSSEARGAAAECSANEAMEYVRQLERYFGSADEGGLKFAQGCFAEAARGELSGSGDSPGRERVQMGLPEEYARADSDLLRLLKAINQLHHRLSSSPNLRAHKASDREEIAKILNRSVMKAEQTPAQRDGPDSSIRQPNARASGGQPGKKGNTAAESKRGGGFRVLGAAAAANAGKGKGLVGDAARETLAKRSPSGFGSAAAPAKHARLEGIRLGANLNETAAGESPRSEGAMAALKRARAAGLGEDEGGRNGTESKGTETKRSRAVSVEGPQLVEIKDRFAKRNTGSEEEERGASPGQNVAVEGPEENDCKVKTGVESAGKGTPESNERARARWFAKQFWDEKKLHFVIRTGVVLEGPFLGKRATRQSVYRVRYDDGREETTGLQKAQLFDENPFEQEAEGPRKAHRKGGNGKKATAAAPADGDGDAVMEQGHSAGVEAFEKASEKDGKASGNGNETGERKGNGNGNGSLARPWRAIEVGWFLERLGAQYGASAQGFQKAWRDYEVSALPDGVRIEYRPRASGDRTDRYYIYEWRGDPSEPAQTFRTTASSSFSSSSTRRRAARRSARCARVVGGKARQ